jgi:hypothetical protein
VREREREREGEGGEFLNASFLCELIVKETLPLVASFFPV